MRKLLFINIMLAIVSGLFAADLPDVVDLGFSADGKYYMFGYYGVDSETSKSYAEAFIVDLATNSFVKDGVYTYTSKTAVSPGFDAVGALLNLYDESAAVRTKYGIKPLNQGRLVYVLLNGAVPEKIVKFRDFQGKSSYEISMDKTVTTSGKVKSSFSLSIKRTPVSGSTSTISAGNPAIKRDDVKDYQIKKVLLSPDEKFMVILILKYYTEESGEGIRFMVETLAVK